MAQELSIIQYINNDTVKKNIEAVLGERTPQFITSVVSLVNSSEALKAADKKSVMGACLTAAALNLPINQNLGFAFIIPYKNNKEGSTVAKCQMGYKGFIQLAMRSGQFKTINVSDVKKGELKGINRLSGEIDFAWLPDLDREKAETIGFVAYIRLTNGFEKSLYMTAEELKQHGIKFSQSMKRGYGLWKDDFDAMAKKTVIKLLLSKYAPMDSDMAKAQEADQAIIKDSYRYVDNLPESSETIANGKEKARILKFIEEAKTDKELEECYPAVQDANDEEIKKAFADKKKGLKK